MSKRERSIFIGVGAAIGILVLDWAVITPLTSMREELNTKIVAEQDELSKDKKLIRSRPLLEKQLKENIDKGLTNDQSPAESQMNDKVSTWSNQNRMTLKQFNGAKTPRPVMKINAKGGREPEKAFMELTFSYTGEGGMLQIGPFLLAIQRADIPVRITDLTMSTNKEGLDDMRLKLGLSTIYLTPEQKDPAATPTAGGTTRPVAGGATTRPNNVARGGNAAQNSTTRAVGAATPTTRSEVR